MSAPCRFCKEPQVQGLQPARRIVQGPPPRQKAHRALLGNGPGLTPLQLLAAASCGSVLAIFCVTAACTARRPRWRGWALVPSEGSSAEAGLHPQSSEPTAGSESDCGSSGSDSEDPGEVGLVLARPSSVATFFPAVASFVLNRSSA